MPCHPFPLIAALSAGLAVALAAAAAASVAVGAFPARSIRLVVAVTAGGDTDFTTRLVAEEMKGRSAETGIRAEQPP